LPLSATVVVIVIVLPAIVAAFLVACPELLKISAS
jgi:hypothetical protein